MAIKNTSEEFGWLAKLFHWLMAILIIGMLCLGLYMTDLPLSFEKLKLYGWHKEFGTLVLFLVCLRLLWHVTNKIPVLPDSIPTIQKWAAHGAHYALYFFMFAMPITGWMMSSAAGLPVSFFGLFLLPNLVAPDEQLRSILVQVHSYLAYALIATICAHTLAALKHHFIDKDNILRRMLPWSTKR